MAPILLTREPAELPLAGRAIAVVAPGYEPPRGVDVIPVEALVEAPAKYLTGPVTLVVVGLSRMMTPANRVKLGAVLLRPRAGVTRASVDDRLFVSDPWRLWWHFKAVGRHEAWDLTDSFLAETRWKASIEMQTPDPFAVDRVLAAMRGVVEVRDAFRFESIRVDVRPVSGTVHDEYRREKEAAFEHEKTIAGIIKRLSAVAQRAEPTRSVPSTSQFFKKPPSRIVRTDLAVDSFLVEQLMDRVNLTNAIAEARS